MRDYLFPPLILPIFVLLVLLPFLALLFVLTGSEVFRVVFGVSYNDALLIFGLIVIGSFINLPLYEREGKEIVMRYRFFGFIYTIRKREKIVVAVNLGGCVFPSILALKVLLNLSSQISLTEWFFAFALTSLVIYYFAKPVPGVGIVVPMFVPPLAASSLSLLTLLLFGDPIVLLPKLSFSVGILSALFGADILHLREIEEVGSGVVSIGGAGTFDGIFLTGIFAVIFSLIMI